MIGIRRKIVVVLMFATIFMAACDSDTSGTTDAKHILGFTPENTPSQLQYEQTLVSMLDNNNVDNHLRWLTKYPSADGTPGIIRRKDYILEKLTKYGLDVDVQTYYPYMANPQEVEVQLEMLEPVQHTLAVKEIQQPWQENFDKIGVGFNEGTPAADLTREVVYVNFGRGVDYDYLASIGVDVQDKIVLVRYGGMQRSEVPYQAYVHDAAGVILYTDPEQDGAARGTVYPEGPWSPPDGIQRGTVYRWTLYPGDPLTPGYEATLNAPRIPLSESSMGKIPPTTPIGYGAASKLLENLGGPVAPDDWQGGLPMTYHIGAGPTKLHMKIDVEYESRPSYNIIARIPGSEQPGKMVILDVHYDSWAYGAYDNTASVATTLELARGLGELKRMGWQPKRSIVLLFTSAEERGITGSTEWTESLGEEKMADVVAVFVNDVISGKMFTASSVPSMWQLFFDATKQVEWPGTSGSAYDNWGQFSSDGVPGTRVTGGGIDVMPFRSHYGVPVSSLRGYSSNSRYHCACDDYRSLVKFMDPELKYSTAVARVDGVLLMRLAGADALPFFYSTYAEEIVGYLQEFKDYQKSELGNVVISVDRTIAAAEEWASLARQLEQQRAQRLSVGEQGFEAINSVLMKLERALLTPDGLPGRPWFKHQIYAAAFHNGFKLQRLPGLYDALEAPNWQAETAKYEQSLYNSLEDAIAITKAAIQ